MNIKSSIVYSLIVSGLIAFLSLFAATYVHARDFVAQNAEAAEKMMPIYAPAATTLPSIPCVTLPFEVSHSLARGMRDTTGGEVKALQIFLAAHFGTPESDIVTGYFGPITEAHVIRLQKELSLPQVGILGPLTRAAIKNMCRTPIDPTGPQISIAHPMTGDHFAKGDIIPVSWYTSGVAAHTGMYLKLETTEGDIIKSMIVPYASGSAMISTTEFCNGDFSDAIYGDCENLREALKDGKKEFKIVAGLFTPEGACFGFCAPSTTPTVVIKESESAAFTMEDPDAGAFTATKTEGRAPLTTTFSIAREGKFTLNFGDTEQTEFTVPGIVCIKAPCIPPAKEITHTYKKAGTYYATLTRTTPNSCETTNGTICADWVSREQNMGYITIEVQK